MRSDQLKIKTKCTQASMANPKLEDDKLMMPDAVGYAAAITLSHFSLS